MSKVDFQVSVQQAAEKFKVQPTSQGAYYASFNLTGYGLLSMHSDIRGVLMEFAPEGDLAVLEYEANLTVVGATFQEAHELLQQKVAKGLERVQKKIAEIQAKADAFKALQQIL